MKVIFDQVSAEYRYPVTKKDIDMFKEYVPDDVLGKIRRIRMGCNIKTTQEGRLARRGRIYDIRINFCLNRGKSFILAEDSKYIDQVTRYGGKIDFDNWIIKWNALDAKYYAFFILAHEVAHIIYCEKYHGENIGYRSSKKEEQWCDDYAEGITRAIKDRKPPDTT